MSTFRFARTLLFVRMYSNEIRLFHMYVGLAGGAFGGYVSARPGNRIIDSIMCGSIGCLLGMFPPIIWGIGAAIAYQKITKKIKAPRSECFIWHFLTHFKHI